MDITEAFSELDADQSGYVQLSHDLHVISLLCSRDCRILSVRELRTLLAMISDLPLHLGLVHSFEGILRQCDQHYNGTRPTVDPLEYETHYDPNLVRPHPLQYVLHVITNIATAGNAPANCYQGLGRLGI